MQKIKIFIIDDSALTRAVIKKILEQDPELEVIGMAPDPIIAERKLKNVQPDVITLDIEMPRMDGLTFLGSLPKDRPYSVVIISGNSKSSSKNAIKALEHGALEIIEKPDLSTPEKLKEVSQVIIGKIKAAHAARKVKLPGPAIQKKKIRPSKPQSKTNVPLTNDPAKNICLIGSSTGGPELLRYIFSEVCNRETGFVIAQHMPAMFTNSFAVSLDQNSALSIKEAGNEDYVLKGQVLIIPGDHHGIIERDLNGYKVSLNKQAKVNRHRPSVDVLFNSGTKIDPRQLTAIILTGMGDDGAKGIKNLHGRGAYTIAQDESSSVVFGMPKRAIEYGAAKKVLAPQEIIEELNDLTS